MKKILSVFLSIIMLAGLCLTCYSANGGMTFTQGTLHKTSKKLTSAPRTIEVVLEVSSSAPNSRLGTIVGTYDGQSGDCFVIEIYTNGSPRAYWVQNGVTTDLIFSAQNVDLRKWGKVHMTITLEENKGTVYLNGDEGQSRGDKTFPSMTSMQKPLAIGGDMRDYNERYLQHTTVYSVALFSDVRSVTEINSDKTNGVNTSDSNLICYYDLTASGNNALTDKSANGYNLTATTVDTGSTTPDVQKNGMTFTKDTVYKTEKALSQVPLVVEADIYLPKIDSPSDSDRPGEIFCNYSSDSEAALYFGIWRKGKPRIYWRDGNDGGNCVIFHNVNVYQGKWIHLTLERDPATGKGRCYIDGVLVQEENFDEPFNSVESAYSNPFVIGGTLASSNSLYFKGKINSVSAYSDVNKKNVIASYDLSVAPKESGTYKIIEDKSGNGYNAKYNTGVESPLIYEKTPITGYDYSFAILGDTQIVSRNDIANGAKDFNKIYDYILDNLSAKKIKCVIGVGDITDNKYPEQEWVNVNPIIAQLDGKVDYILARGNHDSRSWFRARFRYSDYAVNQLDEFYGDSPSNGYFKMTVGNIKYLIMTIDYGCDDNVLTWANSIVAANPDYNVIITTHSFMEADGSITDANGYHPASKNEHKEDGNDGIDIWNEFVKLHKNIVLVLCGHISSDTIVVRQDKGVHGNTVTRVLIDSQNYEANNGSMGFVSMLYFSNGGKTVTYEYYSTVKEAYFLSENQNKSFTLDVVGEKEQEGTTPSQSTTPTQSTTPEQTTTKPQTTTDPVTSESTTVTDSSTTLPDDETDSSTDESQSPESSTAEDSTAIVTTENNGTPQGKNDYTLIIIIAAAVVIAGIITTATILIIKEKKK